MRPAGETKLGFFPIPTEVIPRVLTHIQVDPQLHPTDPKRNAVSILDPCAGEGVAMAGIAAGLNLSASSVYAIELDEARGQTAAHLLGGQTLHPASFHGCQITPHSFGLIYLNPPFSDELGGGRREELGFLERATRLLMPGGILVMVTPAPVVSGNAKFVDYLDSYYHDLQVYRLPDACRRYREIITIGVKRAAPLPSSSLYELYDRKGSLHYFSMNYCDYPAEWFPVIGEVAPTHYVKGSIYSRYAPSSWAAEPKVWTIPRGWAPHTFKKISLTDRELSTFLQSSPLASAFRSPEPRKLPSPPLPLDRGHLGLILASGMLDGDVHTHHGSHIVRGSNYKSEYFNEEESTSTEDTESGAVTTKDVFSQKIVTVLRCLDEDGIIYTHSNDDEAEPDDA